MLIHYIQNASFFCSEQVIGVTESYLIKQADKGSLIHSAINAISVTQKWITEQEKPLFH